MKITAKEAAELHAQSMVARTDVIERVKRDLYARIRAAATKFRAIGLSFNVCGDEQISYVIAHPENMRERFAYNWHEGRLVLTINANELDTALEELRSLGFDVKMKSCIPFYCEFDIRW